MATLSSTVKRSKPKPRHTEAGVVRVVSKEGVAQLERLMRRPPKPTKALVELMRGK